ncbi:MAG: 3-deoxy-manno-octulosonate cytidylyltransferase [Paraglaciecola sp.]|uniref:3-deoxy-manno-octulosonate cytidylyltransferase n=1 Tax=Paraglaciecola sp. TaxID=1920173 RepID=UPI0032671C00
MKTHIVIPARYNSSRLPGKPLLKMNGHSMIFHVYQRALEAAADTVCVATDDRRVFEEVESFGGKVVMTDSQHQSGTDRLAEVASIHKFGEDDIVVNLQGDEPLIPPSFIDTLSEELRFNSSADIVTLACQISSVSSTFNPNIVKVVCDDIGKALYFSRAPIPWDRATFHQGKKSSPEQHGSYAQGYLRHIGLYAYKVNQLKKLSAAPVSFLEHLESLEQLRALSLGMSIFVKKIQGGPPHGVDTLKDYERVKLIMETNNEAFR